MFIDLILLRDLQQHRRIGAARANTANEFIERVRRPDKKESAASGAGQIPHSRLIARRPFGCERQTLDHQRAQVVLKHHVFKVTMELSNCGLSAADRRKRACMLLQ